MKNNLTAIFLIIAEILLLLALFSFVPQEVIASIGNPTESLTNLTIANSFPEVHNITIPDPIILTPNSTTEINCLAIILDWNGDSDIKVVNSTLFDSSVSTSNPDDNNEKYTNSSCQIDTVFPQFNGIDDTGENALANCTFQVEYYANPGMWNCSIQVNDTQGNIGYSTKETQISELLSLGLPDIIQYGTINATEVSLEQQVDVINYGNIKVNLSLEGYGHTQGDGNAMNCTWGSTKNISVNYEKYNLTSSNPGQLDLLQFESDYTNLTATSQIKEFNLTSRISDISEDTTKPTYWRIYVPKGVAGTCQGNIIFGATKAGES